MKNKVKQSTLSGVGRLILLLLIHLCTVVAPLPLSAQESLRGVVTDINGHFMLTLPRTARAIEVNYLGYQRLVVKLEEGKSDRPSSLDNLLEGQIAGYTNGKAMSLKECLAGKKYLLLDFWASWCKPCRKEIPNIMNLYRKYHAEGKVVAKDLRGEELAAKLADLFQQK